VVEKVFCRQHDASRGRHDMAGGPFHGFASPRFR
jgi:hypothetical protein